nr:MAG TPA: hypothetical protein [Caudoviricetes sp.]
MPDQGTSTNQKHLRAVLLRGLFHFRLTGIIIDKARC